tara:strand:- start:3686 stop:5128 length:1443 start_codon:yes stop_codon:yes gene_type:complete
METVSLEPGQQWPGFLLGAEGADERSEYRLVKGAKSPTSLPRPLPMPLGPPRGFDGAAWEESRGRAETYQPSRQDRCPEGQSGAYAVIQYREWAQEYRIFSRVETSSGTAPPDNSGPRISADLSFRGLRKIAESCQYVATCHGGYKTFLTLTFDQAARDRLQAGETTIQREVSRFTDSMQKVWCRGWDAENARTKLVERQESRSEPLLYLWVVEVPENEQGEPNPHVHMLLNWRVGSEHFRAWASRMESLWGQGFAHLEKIKDSGAAGSYMMKAAGYLCKAQGKADQGSVRGNRYGMSAEARAPAWVTIDEKQLHIMGALIADLHQHINEKYGDLYRQRKQLKNSLDRIPRGQTALRRKIGRRLELVRKYLSDNVPVVAGKYQVLIKGKEAFYEFINWARSPGHWRAAIDWLPEKGPGEDWRPGERPDSLWFDRFKKNHYWRRARRAAARLKWSDWEWGQAVQEYEQWGQIAGAQAYDCS